MQNRIPVSVAMPDRRFFALAAYNVGLGHMKDARILALRRKKNPDRWNDMMEVLPLLSQKKYYRTLTYGYARGREPVTYVQRIRAYQVLLNEKTSQKSFVTKIDKNGKMGKLIARPYLLRMWNWVKNDTGV